MSSFAQPWWNLVIIILTLGGLGGLIWLTIANSKGSVPKDGDDGTTGHVWDDDLKELNNPLPRWWVNMFYITIVFGIGYLILFPGLGLNSMMLGWTQTKQYEAEMAAAAEKYDPLFEAFLGVEVPALAEDEKALKAGRRLYLNYCSTCHGSDARGSRGFPNLTDDDWLYGGDPAAIKTTILNGRNGIMPPWGQVLGSEEAVNGMAEYVRSLSGLEHDAAKAAGAKPQFGQFCAACHGMDGAGNQALGAPNLTDDVWLHGSSTKIIAGVINNGLNNQMPPHQNFLGEARAHVLAAYIYSLSQPKK